MCFGLHGCFFGYDQKLLNSLAELFPAVATAANRTWRRKRFDLVYAVTEQNHLCLDAAISKTLGEDPHYSSMVVLSDRYNSDLQVGFNLGSMNVFAFGRTYI